MNYCNIERRYRADQPDAHNLPETMTETISVNQQDIKLALPQIPPASFSKLIAGACRSPPTPLSFAPTYIVQELS
jgi:hypothetical protein